MYGENKELRVSECYRLIAYYNDNYYNFNDIDREIGNNLVDKINKSLNEYNRNKRANFVPVFISTNDWNWIIDHNFTSIYRTAAEETKSKISASLYLFLGILVFIAIILFLRSIPLWITLPIVFIIVMIFNNL